jgi:Flp pilus assembly protein TadD
MLSLNPKLPPPYNLLANSYLREGEPARAVELLTQAVNLNPKNTGAVFMSNLGRAHFMAGNYKAAINWTSKALEANPKQNFAHTLLAMAYALDGDDARARAEAAEVRRLDPGFKVDPEKMLAQSATPAYRMYLETRAIPALRKAGLLE